MLKISYIVATATVFFCLFGFFDPFVEKKTLVQWYALMGGILLCAGISLLERKRTVVRFDTLTILVSAFTGYLLVRSAVSGHGSRFPLVLFCFMLSYYFFKTDKLRIDRAIVWACLLESLCGIGQWTGVIPPDSPFPVTGSFDNPAGLAACLSAGLPFCLYIGNRNRPERILRTASLVTIPLCVILSGSRTGMIAMLIIGALYIRQKYRSRLTARQFRRAAVLIPASILALSTVLFFAKKNSAVGRLLIWDVSAALVADAPVFGSGHGTFLCRYMPAQAAYFENGERHARRQALADNVSHPFNEYLITAIEYGAIGLILLIVPLWILLPRISAAITPYGLSVTGIAVFALFSYPTRYAFVCLVAAYGLARCSDLYFPHARRNIRTGIPFRAVTGALAGAGLLLLVKDAGFEYRWKKATERYPPDAHAYRELYESWNGNPYFLYNYGAILLELGESERCSRIANLCAKYLNDYDVQMLLAENLMRTGKYAEAEIHLAEAGSMCPNRFMPLYRQMEIYLKEGKTEESRTVARTIRNKEIKVHSVLVEAIRKKAKRLLEQQETEPPNAAPPDERIPEAGRR